MSDDMIAIKAAYYSTEKKDQKTNETVFTVSPFQTYPFAENGLLKCIGKTCTCRKGLPVVIKGRYDKKKKAFMLNGYIKIDTEGYDAISSILLLIDPNISESMILSICEAASNDLFSFCDNYTNAEEIIYTILSKGERYLKDKNKINEYQEKQKETARKIISFVEAIKKDKEMGQFLLRYDVPADRIQKIIEKNITEEEIKRNPYAIFNAYDIPMLAADEVAWDTSLGDAEFSSDGHSLNDYDELRLVEYAKYAAKKIAENGSTAFTLKSLTSRMNRAFSYESISRTEISRSLGNLCVCESGSGLAYHEVNGKEYIELDSIWREESAAVFHLKRLMAGKSRKYKCRSIEETESITGMKYNEGQRKAFDIPKTGGVKILTGPPGSGKTAVIKGLIESFSLSGGTVKLAATTGMAAKVLASATEREAQTLNLMLNIMPFDNDNIYSKSINNPVDADFIIVDEVSMLGLRMFSSLLQAVRSGAILLLVGDEDQLQSVEYGDVLHDLINSEKADVYRLTEILRQSGAICENARKVNMGSHVLTLNHNFQVIRCASPESMLSALKTNYAAEDSQILCPVKKGAVSVSSVNAMFEQKGQKPLAIYGSKKFYMNDKIVMTHTNYEENYINGEIGFVVSQKDDGLICQFDDEMRVMSRQSLRDMAHADCITIHKSQGNEFGNVHILLPRNAMTMMTRRMIYTAITRAKKRVYIYTAENAMNSAINNTAERKRTTLLAERISAEF